MVTDRRYWDSNCFLGWLKKESGKYEKCQAVIEKAELGELEIITSAFTLAEVLYLRGKDKIEPDQAAMIRDFFTNEYIILINVDRGIAELAQNVVWNNGIRPKDAIHVASALKAGVPVLDTFDEGLLKMNNMIGDPALVITEPNIPHQEALFEGKEAGPKETE